MRATLVGIQAVQHWAWAANHLFPLKLQRPYPGTPDGHPPEIYKQMLDPLDALTYVAAQTNDPAFAPGGQSLDRWMSLLEQLRGTMTL